MPQTPKTGRVAVVTASGRGIGAACARRLAAQGWTVALLSRSREAAELGEALGGFGLQGSVTEGSDLERLVAATLERYGRIDGLVNNTGDPRRGELLGLTDEDWCAGLDLIILNVVRMARLVTPVMEAQGGGSIVNISAADAYEPELRFPIGSTYRAALGAWTKLFADRYARVPIRMNAILPGIILSDGQDPPPEEIGVRVPLARAGRYDEVADLVAFLLSDAAPTSRDRTSASTAASREASRCFRERGDAARCSRPRLPPPALLGHKPTRTAPSGARPSRDPWTSPRSPPARPRRTTSMR